MYIRDGIRHVAVFPRLEDSLEFRRSLSSSRSLSLSSWVRVLESDSYRRSRFQSPTWKRWESDSSLRSGRICECCKKSHRPLRVVRAFLAPLPTGTSLPKTTSDSSPRDVPSSQRPFPRRKRRKNSFRHVQSHDTTVYTHSVTHSRDFPHAWAVRKDPLSIDRDSTASSKRHTKSVSRLSRAPPYAPLSPHTCRAAPQPAVPLSLCPYRRNPYLWGRGVWRWKRGSARTPRARCAP